MLVVLVVCPGPLLNSIEEDLHNLLTEEIKLRSENLISELRSQLDGLRTQPTDFNEFTHFAIMVQSCSLVDQHIHLITMPIMHAHLFCFHSISCLQIPVRLLINFLNDLLTLATGTKW